jgi:hypothetical protein
MKVTKGIGWDFLKHVRITVVGRLNFADLPNLTGVIRCTSEGFLNCECGLIPAANRMGLELLEGIQ